MPAYACRLCVCPAAGQTCQAAGGFWVRSSQWPPPGHPPLSPLRAGAGTLWLGAAAHGELCGHGLRSRGVVEQTCVSNPLNLCDEL